MTKEIRRVCFPYEGRELGGSHISSLGLIRNIDPERYEARVFLGALDGPLYEFFCDHGISVSKGPAPPRLPRGRSFSLGHVARLAPAVLPLTRLIRAENFDIVHINDGRTHAVWGGPTKFAGAKYLWHHRSDPNGLGLRFAAPLLADRVVSVSQFASPRAGAFSAARKNHVVYSPFDTTLREDRDAARAEILRELGLGPDARLIAYFGNLNRRKRPLLFVETIARLARAAPHVPAVGLFFGAAFDGLDEAVREKMRELGLEDRIRLMGFRSPGARWMAGCDALLVPAVDEPFGRTLVEAMLVRTPIVATRSGGNPEAIRHEETGLLAPPEDAGALAAGLQRLFDEPSLNAAIVDAAEASAKSRFGEKRHAETIMTLYDELLES